MNTLSNHKALVIALSVGVVGVGALIAACSGSSNSNPGGADNGSGGDAGGIGTQPGACANPTVGITFAPMYSAYIPNEDGGAIVFKIPATTDDGNTATWSFSDPSQVNPQVEQIPVDKTGDTVPGVMITINGVGAGGSGNETTGTVTVIATETGGACGSSVLTITQNTQNDWAIGNARYNDGVALHVGGGKGGGADGGGHFGGFPDGGFDAAAFEGFDAAGLGLRADAGSYYEQEGGTACTNCHGDNAVSGPYKDVSHTPEQTGGFSDEDLINIIVNGQVPDGGYFDPTVLVATCDAGTVFGGPNMPQCMNQAFQKWHSFHQWVDITSDEQPGIVCYLRSLAPAPQNGTSSFGGGGGHHHDGGGAPPGNGGGGMDSGGGGGMDSGTGDTGNTDAGTGGD